MIWIILGIIVALAVILVFCYLLHEDKPVTQSNQKDILSSPEPATRVARPSSPVATSLPTPTKGFGAPLFQANDGRKLPVGQGQLHPGNTVWTVGPHGRRLMTVNTVSQHGVSYDRLPSRAVLSDEDYEAEAYFDPSYFDANTVNRLGVQPGAWRLLRVRYPDSSWGSDDFAYGVDYNQDWLMENTLFGDPIFGALEMALIYDGFADQTSPDLGYSNNSLPDSAYQSPDPTSQNVPDTQVNSMETPVVPEPIDNSSFSDIQTADVSPTTEPSTQPDSPAPESTSQSDFDSIQTSDSSSDSSSSYDNSSSSDSSSSDSYSDSSSSDSSFDSGSSDSGGGGDF
jgi:uncharacterized membrane protein YgcG